MLQAAALAHCVPWHDLPPATGNWAAGGATGAHGLLRYRDSRMVRHHITQNNYCINLHLTAVKGLNRSTVIFVSKIAPNIYVSKYTFSALTCIIT